MPPAQIHLVRHGEVENPGRVLYGRLPNFHLSARGVRMTEAAAAALKAMNREVGKIYHSPLERTRQSAAPIAEAFGLVPEVEPGIIESGNDLQGLRLRPSTFLRRPLLLAKLMNPVRPSWGEPYREVADRMHEAIERLLPEGSTSDVVLVSHQLPIWALHLKIAGKALPHLPKTRRCTLSSITSFERTPTGWREVSYLEPASEL